MEIGDRARVGYNNEEVIIKEIDGKAITVQNKEGVIYTVYSSYLEKIK